MIKHVLKTPKNYSFEKVGIKGKRYPVNEITNSSGIIYVETNTGHETTIINHVCDVFYYILSGKGYFIINSQKENFEKSDLVVIRKNEKFTFKGKCKILRITTPPFYPEQEETVR